MWNTRWMAWPVMTVVVRGMEGQKNVGHWGMIYRRGETWMAIKMEGYRGKSTVKKYSVYSRNWTQKEAKNIFSEKGDA